MDRKIVIADECRSIESALEARARRTAKRVELVVVKSRSRTQHANNLGGFQIVDPYYDTVVDGLNYELSAQQVIDRCAERRRG